MIHKKTHVLKVLQAVSLDDTTMLIHFTGPLGFEYESGDWVDLSFGGERPKGGYTYSLSSSPTEKDLAITFKLGISPFKKRLQALAPGDTLYISQYGNDYDFHLKQNRSSVLIAGGIGIAPFRSMLKEMVDTGNKNLVQLVYINKGSRYIFADEINQWAKQLKNIETVYIDSTNLKRKSREKMLLGTMRNDAHHYFIAGPEAMVEATEHLLIQSGIDSKDIRIDSFGGY